jgi:hypothetical protein
MAYQDDKYHRQAHLDAWEHLLGYAVVDKDGDKIGTVKALWEDYTRQPAYLGVATSWLDMGRIHVVPAQFATLSERRKCLRLPFAAEVVKDAPQCHATDEITLSGETKIRDYYYRKGVGEGGFGRETEGSGKAHIHEEHIHEDRPARSSDWTAGDRREEESDPRSFRERVREAVDEGKARISGDREPERPETYGRAEREMGLPFSEERPPLRKIYHETPVAEPVLPREEEADQRARAREEDDDFLPLRRHSLEAERRREEDRDDLPLR